MKTLIVALNSKYTHSALAPWYLKAFCGGECGQIEVREFTINDLIDTVLFSICREKPDVVAFSCYIWNIEFVFKLLGSLKQALPDAKIILGGPEASFEQEKFFKENPNIDFIISGEGEISFKFLLKCLQGDSIDMSQIKGVFSKHGDFSVLQDHRYQTVENLDMIPSPYTEEMISKLGNRIVYFESSRGCPFSCAYCLSATYSGVRYFSMDRVKKELKKLIDARVKQVKFVDRTFNCSGNRAKEIFRFIIEKAKDSMTNFHFEAAPDLFDDEMIYILKEAPAGLIQLEMGIQTLNPMALDAIDRKTDIKKAFYYIQRLKEAGNIHLHLDLIAGLPYEDFESLKESFNKVYSLKPHYLQLGFLKMLKGSKIRNEAESHQYRFREYPPYEVLFNRFVSFDEMAEIKTVENILERYYNSGKFARSVDFIIKNIFHNAYEFYSAFQAYYLRKMYVGRSISLRDSYTILMEFVNETLREEGKIPEDMIEKSIHIFGELLRFDFFLSDRSDVLPQGLQKKTIPNSYKRCLDILKDRDKLEGCLGEPVDVPLKQMLRHIRLERFDYDVTMQHISILEEASDTTVLFNYSKKDRITGLYKFAKVDFKIMNFQL